MVGLHDDRGAPFVGCKQAFVMSAAELFELPVLSPVRCSAWLGAVALSGLSRSRAASIICAHHYTKSVPSGKSHYLQCGDAIVVWSIPANNNIAEFILGWPGNVWELSRLWAPDGHEKNLLTRAISAAVRCLRKLENPDAVVSYADPNAGHTGGVYRAASWIYHGKSEEVRTYRGQDGNTVARRAFHSGESAMKKYEIEAIGYTELKLPGKERFVKPLTRKARKALSLMRLTQ
jgi:hypothetical protein